MGRLDAVGLIVRHRNEIARLQSFGDATQGGLADVQAAQHLRTYTGPLVKSGTSKTRPASGEKPSSKYCRRRPISLTSATCRRRVPESADLAFTLFNSARLLSYLPTIPHMHPSSFACPVLDAHRMTEIAPCQRLQVNDGEGMVAAAVLGLDICQVPDKMVGEELAGGTLVELLPGHRPPAMPISIVMPSVRLQPPRVRALLNALAQLERR